MKPPVELDLWPSSLFFGPSPHLLKKLSNDELAIEQTDIHPTPGAKNRAAAPAEPAPKSTAPSTAPRTPTGRDSGGGFNPYDNTGRPKRR